jgi:transcriptional repressor NrdR
VIKRDGQRESFDRSKLLRGIVTACGKTGIPATRLEALVDDIEAELQQRAAREVSSTEVGEAVLKSLKQLSEVAYVRFASVYRKFQGIRDFVEELHALQGSTSLAAGNDDPTVEPASTSSIEPTPQALAYLTSQC